ncbi:MAG: 23S rRNA (uracil(1939)-C(5))-methyltransferase RlmD [Firmicutes bacterium]|nr:23S rRNA (uracil(1939)-C(5))-methyltransferase RlmD [Bacillota bacterium]
MKKNDKFIGKCVAYNKEGSGIVKYDNTVFFVPGMIKDEVAEILCVKMLKSYGYGKIIKLIETSKNRVEPRCEVYKKCGGCHLMHMNKIEQQAFKTNVVKDCFRSIANMDVSVNETLDMLDPYRYRNKVQVPFKADKGMMEAGFYRLHSNDIISFNDCLVQTKDSNNIIRFIKENYYIPELRHVLIKHAHNTDQIMIVLIVKKYPFSMQEKLINDLLNRFNDIHSIIANINDKETNVILGNKEIVLAKDDHIQEELNGMYFNISSKSFYQINPKQTKVLYDLAIEFANISKDDVVIDLYCGTGTIGLLASKYAKKVIGVEIVEQAIEDAKVNAINNHVDNIEFICADAAKGANLLLERNIKSDVVIVDPPRKGCDKQTLEAISIFDPSRLVYVSCDPATLARDCKILCEQYHYQIKKIQPVDMFPNTSHVETVCLLSKLHEAKHHVNVTVDMDEMDLSSW